jgi:CRP-like cAMP-binding protein
MLGILKVVTFKKGEIVCQKDKEIDNFGIILNGSLRVGKTSELTPI